MTHLPVNVNFIRTGQLLWWQVLLLAAMEQL
jgi:hypothetical protein